MGFYGNITNTSKTTFVFDRTYPNRYTMENKMGSDGVYMGRYVLIEYDEGVSQEDYYRAFYWNPADSWFYGSAAFEAATRVTIVSSVPEGSSELIVSPGDIIREKKTSTTYTDKYYIVKDNQFIFAIDSDSNYVRNFNIDRKAYGESRGWDSTVWVKEYVNKQEKYVQIAELNTVIPSFGVSADAPTQTPITPHFDQNSTNVYYKLHVQPQWGFRVARSEGYSDTNTTRETITYDPATGITDTTSEVVPANIFYNKNGLDVTKANSKVSAEDKITFLPSGTSGNLYNKHDGSGETQTAKDIYELSLVLPSLGNTISTIWDIVYGPSRNQNIEWGNKNGLRLTRTTGTGQTFTPVDAQTISGCINSVQDLIGTIVKVDRNPSDLTEEGTKYIYFDEVVNKYYRVHKVYHYEEVSQATYEAGLETEVFYSNVGAIWNNNLPFEIAKIFTQTWEYDYVEIPELADKLNTIHGMLLQMNKMLEFTSPETRDRETIQGVINTVNDLIDKISELVPRQLMVADAEGRIHSAALSLHQPSWDEGNNKSWVSLDISDDPNNPVVNLYHTFNPEEDMESGEDLNNSELDSFSYDKLIPDEMGHIVKKDAHKVVLPFNYKHITSGNTSAVTAPGAVTTDIITATNSKDAVGIKASNKWLKFNTDKDTKSLKIGHELSPAIPNQPFGLEESLTVEDLDTDNTFEVPCFTLDEAGHVIAASTQTVSIPELFNQINVGGTSTEETNSISSSGLITADTLKDVLGLGAGNKWIQLNVDVNTDTIGFRHYVKIFTETVAATDLDSVQTFPVQELVWDNAGHIVSSVKRTYTLPDGFKVLSIGAASVATDVGSSTGGNLTATIQNDSATINSQNRWITLSTTGKTLEVGHAAAGTASLIKGQAQDKTLTFGDTFKVLHAGIDQTGHTQTLTDYTITLPTPSLANGTGNIVTDMSLNQTTGAFTEIKANVGTLPLTGYVVGSNTGSLVATDSINVAFGKVQSNLNLLNGNASTPGSVAYQIAQVVAGADTNFDTLKEVADWINSDTTGAASMQTKISNLETLVGNTSVGSQIDTKLVPYQTKLTAGTDYVIPSTLNNYVRTNQTYTFGSYSAKTLVEILTSLDSRLAALETP